MDLVHKNIAPQFEKESEQIKEATEKLYQAANATESFVLMGIPDHTDPESAALSFHVKGNPVTIITLLSALMQTDPRIRSLVKNALELSEEKA